MNKLGLATLLVALLHGAGNAAVLAPGPALADTRAVTFESALQQALLNDATLQQSTAGTGIAAQDTRRARAPFLPRLDLSSSGQRIEAYGSIPGLETLVLGGKRRAYYTSSALTLGMNVFNGGADLAGLRLAREKEHDAQLQVYLQRVAVARAVLDSFHALRQARFDLRMAALQAASKANMLKLVESDASLGRRSALALSEAQYEAEQSALDAALRQRAESAARRDLSWLMGEENSSAPVLDEPDAARARDLYRKILVRNGFDELARSSEVDVAASRIAQARLEVARARSRYLPKLDIVATNAFAGLSQSGLGSAIRDQNRDKSLLGFTLTWNLFNGFDTAAEIKGASLRVAAAAAAHENALAVQRKQVAALTRPLTDALENERIVHRKLALAERKLDISRVKLDLGKADAAGHHNSELELELQRLELQKQAELIDYYRGQVLLRAPAMEGTP